MRPKPDRDDVAELRLAVPGLLHSLSNALFAIQGHGQRVGATTPDLEAEKAAILRAADQAQHAVEVLRHMVGEGAGRPVQAGILLHRLCEILNMPAREAGLRLDLQHSSPQTPEPVDGTLLCRTVTATISALIDELPECFEGQLRVDLASQSAKGLEILVLVQPDSSLLPFPLDLEQVVASLGPRFHSWGARLSGPEPEGTLRLAMPTVGAESR